MEYGFHILGKNVDLVKRHVRIKIFIYLKLLCFV